MLSFSLNHVDWHGSRKILDFGAADTGLIFNGEENDGVFMGLLIGIQ